MPAREPSPEPEPVQPPAPAAAAATGQGLCAVVLYDYEVRFVSRFIRTSSHLSLLQAAEDNEMNLAEGELIEQVEEIDEGWWSGIGPGGKSGLFPGMYSLSVGIRVLMLRDSELR
jgi:hypothetical protein